MQGADLAIQTRTLDEDYAITKAVPRVVDEVCWASEEYCSSR